MDRIMLQHKFQEYPDDYLFPEQGIVEFLLSRYKLNDVPAVLSQLARQGQAQLCPAEQSRINIGLASCGQAAGAELRAEVLQGRPDFRGTVNVHSVGCIGACYAEPLISVRTPEGLHYLFAKANGFNHSAIIRTAKQQTFQNGAWIVLREKKTGIFTGFEDLTIERVIDEDLADFFRYQKRHVSGHCGLIDPCSLAEYVATGGYFALAGTLLHNSPGQVIAEIKKSGLRGRGGGGFFTGDKWAAAAASSDPVRVVVANADEGDPGAYMNRALLESDPHQMLEGLILAAYAIGAERAHVFVRHEYPLSVSHLRKAISDNYAAGLLGRNILGSDFHLDVEITQSGGAFVCGEETALLQVMQGHRGEPAPRPPFPTERGLDNHPTVINNVETLANIPWIIGHGADQFRQIGNEQNPGTKIFCLTGDIGRSGSIEVPLGTDTQTVVEKIGGMKAERIKALQIGGPSGGFIAYSNFPLDFSSLEQAGAMMGSGGLVVLDHSHCLVSLAQQSIEFMVGESCGQCLYCRDGLAALQAMLEQLTTNRAGEQQLDNLVELSRVVSELSRCALGRSAVNPLLTSLRYFPEEYAAHVQHICPAGQCREMIRFDIVQSACTDCLVCYKSCPLDAINLLPILGPARYQFDDDSCVRCGICVEVCPHACIVTKPRYAN